MCLRLSKNLNSPIRYAEESLGVISFEIVLTYITWKRKSKGWTHKVKKKAIKIGGKLSIENQKDTTADMTRAL